jgi:hypothetical protein
MRRIITLAFTLVLLGGCAPALAPTIERPDADLELVLVTVTALRDMYDVTATIVDATTEDARCAAVGVNSWCSLGDLEQGQVVTITASGPPGVGCTVAGYLREDQQLTSYRPFACRVARSP